MKYINKILILSIASLIILSACNKSTNNPVTTTPIDTTKTPTYNYISCDVSDDLSLKFVRNSSEFSLTDYVKYYPDVIGNGSRIQAVMNNKDGSYSVTFEFDEQKNELDYFLFSALINHSNNPKTYSGDLLHGVIDDKIFKITRNTSKFIEGTFSLDCISGNDHSKSITIKNGVFTILKQ